jgi:hypothetical protein
MAPEDLQDEPINARPTKAFFVDMITRDIALEQAVLDLVDNSVDAANRDRKGKAQLPLQSFAVTIAFSNDRFELTDNCGGFDKKTARDYAFRFGRPDERPSADHSIGQFGIGMKRALFKIGNRFSVRSATTEESWAIDVSVPKWKKGEDWTFPWQRFPSDARVSTSSPGTEIIVEELRPEVSSRLGTKQFANGIEDLLASKHRQFIADGLSISINGRHLTATRLDLLFTELLTPGVDLITYTSSGKEPVKARIIVGVGESKPQSAGWYIVCNGRPMNGVKYERFLKELHPFIEEAGAQNLMPAAALDAFFFFYRGTPQ